MPIRVDFYEKWHGERKLQKRIIGSDDFTYRNLIRMIRRFAWNKEGVLDVGCGVGTIDFYLAAKEKRVTGIEISQNALRVARENAKIFGLDQRIEFINQKLPGKKPLGKFDLVICSEVIEHIKDEDGLVKEMARSLKRDGVLVLSTPSINAPLHRLGKLKSYDESVGHLRRYTVEDIKKLFEKSRLKVIHTEKTEGVLRNLLFTNSFMGKLLKFVRGPISDLATRIDNLTIPIFGESQIYVVATKV